MIHATLAILAFSGLLAVANQSASEAPSGIAPGRMAVTNQAGQTSGIQNDVPRRELQLAQNPGTQRPGTASQGAAQGLGTVYVVPQSVVIRDGLGGRAVTRVNQGTPLTVLADERLQLQIRTPEGQVGYIPKRQVQSAPPSASRNTGGLIREDRSAVELRTAASMRGLSDEAKQMARSEGISEEAIRSAEQFERFALSITDAELDLFLTQGGLNP